MTWMEILWLIVGLQVGAALVGPWAFIMQMGKRAPKPLYVAAVALALPVLLPFLLAAGITLVVALGIMVARGTEAP